MSARADLADVYRRQLPRCATLNRRNRLRIVLETLMTPEEAFRVRDEWTPRPIPRAVAALKWLRRRLPEGGARQVKRVERRVRRWLQPGPKPDPESKAWAKSVGATMSLPGKDRPERFRRQRLSRAAALYAGPGEAAGKVLTIVFTGLAQRVMMPSALFLQHLDAAATDVLILRDPTRGQYEYGVPGFAASLAETIDRVATLRDRLGYRRCVVIGSSAGGFPAIVAGMALGAEAIVSAGGNNHVATRHGKYNGVPVADWLTARRLGTGRVARIIFVHGADAPTDAESAGINQALLGGEIVAVGNPARKVGHNVLFELAETRRLGPLLAQWLYGVSGAGRGERDGRRA